MKKIVFVSPADGEIIESPDIKLLRILILYVDNYWTFGSGQGEFTFKEKDKDRQLLITFDKDWGFHVEFQSNHEPTQVSLGKGDYDTTVSPYIGGNSWVLPTIFFITREETLLVVDHFLKTGERAPSIHWGNSSEINWHYGYEG